MHWPEYSCPYSLALDHWTFFISTILPVSVSSFWICFIFHVAEQIFSSQESQWSDGVSWRTWDQGQAEWQWHWWGQWPGARWTRDQDQEDDRQGGTGWHLGAGSLELCISVTQKLSPYQMIVTTIGALLKLQPGYVGIHRKVSNPTTNSLQIVPTFIVHIVTIWLMLLTMLLVWATTVHISKTSLQLLTTTTVDVVGVVSVTGWALLLGWLQQHHSTHPQNRRGCCCTGSEEVDCYKWRKWDAVDADDALLSCCWCVVGCWGSIVKILTEIASINRFHS